MSGTCKSHTHKTEVILKWLVLLQVIVTFDGLIDTQIINKHM